MKQLKEAWNLVFGWLGNGKKTIIGIAFVVVGFLWNYFSESSESLQHMPFVVMMAGALCLVNALFSKLSGENINLLFFILIFVVILELGVYLMGGEELTFTGLVSIWGPCVLFVWALHYALLEASGIDGVVKRIVIAFFELLVGAIAIGIVFGVPIWLAAVV